MTVNIESIEIILESECTSRSPGIPVLALNAVCVIQMFEWTGDVSAYYYIDSDDRASVYKSCLYHLIV